MADNNYTCFVISPIGDEETDVRNSADAALEYLIIPSLRSCGFDASNIKRADKLFTTGSINGDILLQIRRSDLCIIDVTGRNPNVMYECGLRHGNGKPYIMIMKSGEKLPFDIAGIRMVMYDLSTVPSARKSQDILEKYILELLKSGFVRDEGTDSISSLSELMRDTYNRVGDVSEKLDIMQKMFSSGISNSVSSGSINVVDILQQLSPTEAFAYALQKQDIALTEGLLPYVEPVVNEKTYITTFIAAACSRGSTFAAKYIIENWNAIVGIVDDISELYELVGCYISWCNRHDTEVDNIENFKMMSDYISKKTEDPHIKAGLCNQKNRLYYGAYSNTNRKEYLDIAIDSVKRAIELNPTDGSFYYNLATLLRGSNYSQKEAIEAINKCLEFDAKKGKDDDDHLLLAYKIYSEYGENVKAADTLERLKKINPYKVSLLLN